MSLFTRSRRPSALLAGLACSVAWGLVACAPAVWAQLAATADSTVIPAAAVEPHERVSTAAGWGISRWGPIPQPSDSNRVALHQRSMPLWEKTLVYPYDVVKLPFRAVAAGLGATVVWLDDSGIIYHLKQLLGPKPLPYGVWLNFQAGGSSGVGGGLTFYHDALFGPRNRGRLLLETTNADMHKVGLGLLLGKDTPNELELGAGYRKRPDTRYYGLGPTAREQDESFFAQELTWGGVGYRRYLGDSGLSLLGEGLFSAVDARGPRERDSPSIEERFAGALPLGYAERSDGLTLSLTLESDTAQDSGRPVHGGVRRLKAEWFRGTNAGRPEFWSYRAELQQFIPLWYSQRALALRGLVSWLEPTAGAPIPFTRLLTNDDPDLLRGFPDFRWRDRGLAILTAEYRFPWFSIGQVDGPGLDLYLLTDFGQVFHERNDLSLRRMTDSYGVGLRLIERRGFRARLEVARSDEGTTLRLRADQVFQYAKGGLFHGRDPIPSR